MKSEQIKASDHSRGNVLIQFYDVLFFLWYLEASFKMFDETHENACLDFWSWSCGAGQCFEAVSCWLEGHCV